MIENDKGQKANIGIGFVDRNDAFDFISSLDDYTKQKNREKGIDKYDVKELEKDFSLKGEEKIEIKIRGITDKKDKPKAKGGLKLAPPRGSRKPAAKPQASKEPEENKGLDDLFSNDVPNHQTNSDALFDF